MQEAAYLTELRSLIELQRQHHDQPLVEMGRLHTRANLAIVEPAADGADRITGTAAQLIPDVSRAACTEDPPRTAVGLADATRRQPSRGTAPVV